MSASVLERNSVDEQRRLLTALVGQLRQEVGDLRSENAETRRENAELRQPVSELRCDVGDWKSRHADAVKRNVKLQAELDLAKAEIRQLKAERFGKPSEKQSATDRSNDLDDPRQQAPFSNRNAAKKKRGQQPGRPAPQRRDDPHCWAHVRRDFVRVGKGDPELRAWALGWLRQIRERYHLNRQRLQHASGTPEFAAVDVRLRQHASAMAAQRDTELTDDKLRQPCRKALVSLNEHYSGLTLFVGDPRIPLDNNDGERLIRNSAVGRKNYYGSGAEWSGRLAMMLFSLFATLTLWKINPRTWLNWYFEACAVSGGKAPPKPASFLPWNLAEDRLAELRHSTRSEASPDTS